MKKKKKPPGKKSKKISELERIEFTEGDLQKFQNMPPIDEENMAPYRDSDPLVNHTEAMDELVAKLQEGYESA